MPPDDPNQFDHFLGNRIQVISLQPGTPATIVIRRRVPRARLVGMFFDLDKAFLLPSAMAGIRQVRQLYSQHPGSNLLVVGHTDTSGRDEHNLQLSLERAKSVAAFLRDDTGSWEAFFHDDEQRASTTWGTREVQLMLSALPQPQAPFFVGNADGHDSAETTAAVRQFQSTKGLDQDGVAGPNTRNALITDYMALDNTSLPAGIVLTAHGCGENFPVEQTGDDVEDAENRRVEFFFFDGPITPPPPGETSARDSSEYPQWLASVTDTFDFTLAGAEKTIHPFRYGFPIGAPSPWSTQAIFRVVGEDGTDERSLTMQDGIAVANYRIFEIVNSRPGLRYLGFIEESPLSVAVFGPVELNRIADPSDSLGQLPLPAGPPLEDEGPPDSVGPVTGTGPDPFADQQAVANATALDSTVPSIALA